jgi:hypothetical protein
MQDLPTFRDPVRLSRARLFPNMGERKRRLLAALSGALFGGLTNGVAAQILLMPFADVRSRRTYLVLWMLAVTLGALLGAPVLRATLDRFDYRISFHNAAAALLIGQVQAALHVWFGLSRYSLGVTSLLASAVVVWVVTFVVRSRASPEPR